MYVSNDDLFTEAPAELSDRAPTPEVERAEPASTAPAWVRAFGRAVGIAREAVAPEVRAPIGALVRDFVREVSANVRKVRAEDAVHTLVVATASAVLAGMRYISERIEQAARDASTDTSNG